MAQMTKRPAKPLQDKQTLGGLLQPVDHREYRVIEYSLTKQGRSILQATGRCLLSNKALTRIREVCKNYGSMPYLSLLNEVHSKYPEYVLKSPWMLPSSLQ